MFLDPRARAAANKDREEETSPDMGGGIGGFMRNFAIGVAEGSMASNHPTGRMFGAAMSGAMSPVYQDQQTALERRQAAIDAADFEAMSEAGFTIEEPEIDAIVERMMKTIEGQRSAAATPPPPQNAPVESFKALPKQTEPKPEPKPGGVAFDPGM